MLLNKKITLNDLISDEIKLTEIKKMLICESLNKILPNKIIKSLGDLRSLALKDDLF